MKKVAIIGGGWYGCHIASSLMSLGVPVQLYEKEGALFTQASSRNQNRLHQGFHYPRCSVTRAQSRRGFYLFKKHYSSMLSGLKYNLYAVDSESSTIDFDTYKLIMSGSGLDFEDVSRVSPFLINNVSGVVDTAEEFINPDIAGSYFSEKLKGVVNFSTPIKTADLPSLKRDFDLVVDCTWLTSGFVVDEDIYFEPCIYFYYESSLKEDVAITIMDGNFFSIYPYVGSVYTLTSVEHTPISVEKDFDSAQRVINQVKSDANYIASKRALFEAVALHYLPFFSTYFTFKGVEFAVKTKFKSGSAGRYVKSYRDGNFLAIFSGKIDTIFDAEAIVQRVLISL